jgi:hypothetical protein
MECSIDMNMYAVWTYSIDMDMDMQHGHGHAARIWSCGMGLDSGHAWMSECR